MRIDLELDDVWAERLRNVAARMGCEAGPDVLGRALSLADVITFQLAEPGAKVILDSPTLGPSTLVPAPLYGHDPGLSASAGLDADQRLPTA
jgi:hypothetical protein